MSTKTQNQCKRTSELTKSVIRTGLTHIMLISILAVKIIWFLTLGNAAQTCDVENQYVH